MIKLPDIGYCITIIYTINLLREIGLVGKLLWKSLLTNSIIFLGIYI